MDRNTLKKTWSLLDEGERKKASLLFFLMLLGTFLETLGIGLVVPALTSISSPSNEMNSTFIGKVGYFFGVTGKENLINLGLFFIISVYFIKTIFLTFLTIFQSNFSFGIQQNLSLRLFSIYVKQPYLFHLNRNSAELIRNIGAETHYLSIVIRSIMTLVTELLVLLGVSCLLLVAEPLASLIIFLFLGLISLTFSRYSSVQIKKWGSARIKHDGLKIQSAQEGLGGAKDMKLLGRESFFIDEYAKHNKISVESGKKQSVLQQLPSFWLEFLALIALMTLIFVMLKRGYFLEDIFPILGLYGMAAFRLLPSVNRVLSNTQTIKYGQVVVETLYNEISKLEKSRKFDEARGKKISFEKEVCFDKLSFKYPGSENYTLSNINLTIRKGQFIGFLGPSGSGKSTLIDTFLGLLKPQKGFIKVDGIKLTSANLKSWQKLIGYVPQVIYLTDDTLLGNIAFGVAASEININAVWTAAKAANLNEWINSLPSGLQTYVGERGVRISGGQRQRIGIARALYHNPDILVLDEATSSLDIKTEESVMKSVRDLIGKKTILIITHRLSTVSNCDFNFTIKKGVISHLGFRSK
jgi:ABC-type multidrug transport system fused ATPase/permease subunit